MSATLYPNWILSWAGKRTSPDMPQPYRTPREGADGCLTLEEELGASSVFDPLQSSQGAEGPRTPPHYSKAPTYIPQFDIAKIGMNPKMSPVTDQENALLSLAPPHYSEAPTYIPQFDIAKIGVNPKMSPVTDQENALLSLAPPHYSEAPTYIPQFDIAKIGVNPKMSPVTDQENALLSLAPPHYSEAPTYIPQFDIVKIGVNPKMSPVTDQENALLSLAPGSPVTRSAPPGLGRGLGMSGLSSCSGSPMSLGSLAVMLSLALALKVRNCPGTPSAFDGGEELPRSAVEEEDAVEDDDTDQTED